MARPLRIECRGGLYHVASRGPERRDIVRDDDDGRRWTDLLDTVATRRQWRVLAWALMGDHFHLFVRTPEADLSAGMHDLDSGYATGVAEKLSALDTEEYLERRAQRGSGARFRRALRAVPDVPPDDADRL